MEKNHSAFEEDSVPLPEQSRVSTVLNGMGNGMMLGGIPFVGLEFHSILNKTEISRPLKVANIFATVAGCAIGGVIGMREARQIDSYRRAVSQKIDHLDAQVQTNNAKIDQWAARLEAQPAPESDEKAR